MLGQSIYISKFDETFIPKDEVDIYFTSFHIQEEFNDQFSTKAKSLLKILNEYHKTVIVDISKRGIEALGYKDIYSLLKENKIDILRLDFGFSEEEIVEISNYVTIGVNASTSDYHVAKKIKEKGNKVVAIHNFYPRLETGLDESFFMARNEELKQMDVPVMAFIQGDKDYRGPLFEGLPTLESQRNMKPYVAYLQMKYLYGIENVLVGDNGISDEQLQLIKQDTINIPCHLHEPYTHFYNQVFEIREDSPHNLMRLTSTRSKDIKPAYVEQRQRGDITIDNENYLRYCGEIQITKIDRNKDDRINIMGTIDKDYLGLLEILSGKMKIKFVQCS